MIFLIPKASFQQSGTCPSKNTPHLFPLIFILRRTPLACKTSMDLILCAVSTILVRSIDPIRSILTTFSKTSSMLMDTLPHSYSFMESFKTQMLYKIDLVNLRNMYLSSELHPLILLASYNGTKVRLVHAHNATRNRDRKC